MPRAQIIKTNQDTQTRGEYMPIDFKQIAETIYDTFVTKYTEAFSYLFSGAVQTSPEIGSGQQTAHSFCGTYRQLNPKKFPHDGKEYREVERTSASLFWAMAFSQEAYSADEIYALITDKQAGTDDILTRASFNKILARFDAIKAVANHYQALQAMLIFSDVGKSPLAKDKARAFGLHAPEDHDDFMGALLAENKDDIAKVLPSIKNIDAAVLLIMKNISSSMRVHQGHVKHLEGGAIQLLSTFVEMCTKNNVTQQALDIAFAIQLCDVAASSAQNDPLSCCMTESSFQAYLDVYQLLDDIRKGSNLEDAYDTYYKQIAEKFEMVPQTPSQYVAIRVGALTRATSGDEIADFDCALQNLDHDDMNAVIEMMKPGGTYDSLPRNPSFFNGLLLNAKTKHGTADAVIKGLLYQVRVLEHITQQPIPADKVLCFQPLAAKSANDSTFYSQPFDPNTIELDDRFNVCPKKLEEPTLQYQAK